MTDITPGPLHVYANLTELLSAPGQGQAGSILTPDPNQDRGPSVFFQGTGIPDIRAFYPKDKVIGYTGVVPSHLRSAQLVSASQIPSALSVNNIAAAQAPTNGTAMVLAGASTGITLNVPIIPFLGYGQINGGTVVTTAIALDFGFAFGNVTAATAQIQVADSTKFIPGMPLVIGGVGNAGGTTCLLTNVKSIDDATHITLQDLPAATNATAPIGTGNLWGPSVNGFPTPTAALPYIASGPGLFFDAVQGIARGVQVSSTDAGSVGGNFLVSGYDIYGMAMSELITLAAGVNTGWGKKAFNYITSVVPQFTDASVSYAVGTSDVFGYHVRSDLWEDTRNSYEGQTIGNSAGWTAADTTSPATTTTGDVRGTLQVSANGGGASILGGNASNGAIVNLAMSGRRLLTIQTPSIFNIARGFLTDTRPMYGCTQT